jgi:hypothetical protein
MDNIKNQQIKKQVERWDLFARLTPTMFLLTTLLLTIFDIVKIEYAFYVGLIGFAVTAVTWWWWAIFTIKYLITTLARASANLTNVDQEVADVKMELRKLKDEK